MAAATVMDAPAPAAMTLLEHGIPLSLLLDRVLGPRSEELLRDERPTPRVPVQSR